MAAGSPSCAATLRCPGWPVYAPAADRLMLFRQNMSAPAPTPDATAKNRLDRYWTARISAAPR
jgi:hypothetical protein